MAKIVVEVRKNRVLGEFLDRTAEICLSLGHSVSRWRGPLSGRMPESRYLPPCDLAILVNGAHAKYRSTVEQLRARGSATLFIELGWHPQAGMFQVDYAGVNAAASWVNEPLGGISFDPLEVRESGDLLVLLQLDDDTQVTERSPWFRDMESFVRFIAANSGLPVRVRAHPLAKNLDRLRRLTLSLGAAWDNSASLQESLRECRAVACINSSAGVTALVEQLPVLCFGEAIYRRERAVYCLSDDPFEFERASTELSLGISRVDRTIMGQLTERILARQWTPAELPVRLPAEIAAALERASSRKEEKEPLNDRFERTWRSIADLPASWLYRKRRWKAAG